MTAGLELVLADVVVVDEDGLLAIELLRHHKQFLLLAFVLLGRRGTSEEGYQLAPAMLAAGILALQLVQVFLAQQDGLGTQRLQEFVAILYLMELGQTFGSIGDVLQGVLVQEL